MRKHNTPSLFLIILALFIVIGFSGLTYASEPANPSISLPIGQGVENEAEADVPEVSEAVITTAWEVNEMQRVYDRADLLTQEEIAEFERKTAEIQAKHGMEVILVTTNDTEGKSSENYASDFYDDLFDNTAYQDTSGIILVLDMDNRLVTAVNTGRMIDIVNDEDITVLTSAGAQYMKSSDYGGAARTLIDRVEAYIQRGVVAGQHRVDRPVDPGPNGITPQEAGASGVAGLGTAASFYVAQRRKYKGQKKPLRYNLHANRMISLLPFTDHLLDTKVTAIPLPRQSQHFGGGDSGPTSSTFTGSSGTTHSGGSSGF